MKPHAHHMRTEGCDAGHPAVTMGSEGVSDAFWEGITPVIVRFQFSDMCSCKVGKAFLSRISHPLDFT